MFNEIDNILKIRNTYRITYNKYVALIGELENLKYIMHTGWQLLH